MYPHTVTLYSRRPEVDGHASYELIELDECRAEPVSGIERALSGEINAGAMDIIVFGNRVAIKPKDRMVIGDDTDNDELPPDTALVVVSASPVWGGSKDIHHWEVRAR